MPWCFSNTVLPSLVLQLKSEILNCAQENSQPFVQFDVFARQIASQPLICHCRDVSYKKRAFSLFC
jgi:hypothetical protein